MRGYLKEPSVAYLPGAGRGGGELPGSAARWGTLPLSVAGRTDPEGQGGRRIVNVSVVVATAVNSEGRREIIGMDVGTSEDGASWLAFLRSLSARGLGGVKLVVSDAHQGLRGRYRHRLRRSQLAAVPHPLHDQPAHSGPQARQPWVANMVRTIYQQPSPDEVHAQLDRVTDQLQDRFLRSPLYWTRPDPTSWPSPTSHSPTGRRSGPTTPWSVSTRRYGAAPMWWASSLTGRPCAAWSAPSWLSSTTNGPLAVDTSHLSC